MILFFGPFIVGFFLSSHVGFLPKFVQALKDINFLREDLIFSVHSIEVIYARFYFKFLGVLISY